jgi:peptidoglycan hydrolase-like protein with peptidoglycan-binding domain
MAARTLKLAKPLMHGPDVQHFQTLAEHLGYPTGPIDGIFGDGCAREAQLIRYDFGYPTTGANVWTNGVVGARLIRVMEGHEKLPAAYQERAKARKAANALTKPLPTPMGNTSEFKVQDAEGAPSDDGHRYHAGKDWFAPGGTILSAPARGPVLEARPSRGNSGQVFGGTVKIQGPKYVHVFRHVNPGVVVGQTVAAGAPVARVTDWTDGPDHSHCEVWLTFSGGYDFENMVDPVIVYRDAHSA